MDVRGIHAAPVAELWPDPVPAVRGRTADVRQDHPVAARDEQGDFDVRCRGPRPERATVDVDHGREPGIAGVGWGGDPGLDRATGAGCVEPPHRGLDEAALPGRAERGPRRPARPAGTIRVEGHQLHGPRPERAEDRDRPRGSHRQGVAGRVGPRTGSRPRARNRRIDRRTGPGIQAEPHRVRPAAVADRGHDRARIEPVRAGPTGHHPAVEVRVGPVADRSIEVWGERPRGGGSVRRPEEDPGADVVERIGLEDADRGHPATVGRERAVVGERRRAPGPDVAVRRRRRRPPRPPAAGACRHRDPGRP